jgi:hypothetical protein
MRNKVLLGLALLLAFGAGVAVGQGEADDEGQPAKTAAAADSEPTEEPLEPTPEPTPTPDQVSEIACGLLVPEDAENYDDEIAACTAGGPSNYVYEEPEPEFYTPTKKDFKLKVKELSKTCFGSAGCSVDVRVQVTYLGIEDPDPSKTYELTYKIVGGEDQLKNTIDIVGGEYEVAEHYVSTFSEGSKLQAIVLRVSEF